MRLCDGCFFPTPSPLRRRRPRWRRPSYRRSLLPYPRRSDRLLRFGLRLNGVGVRATHRRKRLCTGELGDGYECEQSSYQVTRIVLSCLLHV